jgi:predicted dinucleotide-binding enzyme
MKIAIFGGTGKLGKALAMRLHHNGYEISIGSRDRVKAVEASRAHDDALAFDQQGKQS